MLISRALILKLGVIFPLKGLLAPGDLSVCHNLVSMKGGMQVGVAACI